MSNAKNWCFTINNFDADVLERFEDLTTLLGSELSYFVLGKEIGENGTPHIQGYIQFTKRVRLAKVLATIGQAHCEVARGSPRQASDYCKKENDWQEFGNLVQPGMFDILEVADMYVILAQ